MNWYLEALKKYAVFGGRARRKEYWMFSLFNFIFAFSIGFMEGFFGVGGESLWGPISGLYALAVIIPGIAVTVRRLHDTGRSGWWLFVALVPIVGPLAVLWFMIQEGESTENIYGPDPKNPADGPTYQPQTQQTAAPMG
jgi:uncharacterized membrane protein YhaH (DUF805 family)